MGRSKARLPPWNCAFLTEGVSVVVLWRPLLALPGNRGQDITPSASLSVMQGQPTQDWGGLSKAPRAAEPPTQRQVIHSDHYWKRKSTSRSTQLTESSSHQKENVAVCCNPRIGLFHRTCPCCASHWKDHKIESTKESSVREPPVTKPTMKPSHEKGLKK